MSESSENAAFRKAFDQLARRLIRENLKKQEAVLASYPEIVRRLRTQKVKFKLC